MKKEIKCWANVYGDIKSFNDLSFYDDENFGHKMATRKAKYKSIPCTIILDIPEPKVEITPSEIDVLVDTWRMSSPEDFNLKTFLKQKLFPDWKK